MKGRTNDKIVGTLEEAIATISNGASIAIGGFSQPGFPRDLLAALAASDHRDLHLITNGGVMTEAIEQLAAEHRVRKISAGFPFTGAWNTEVFEGNVEVEVLPQGTLAERLRAGGAGIAAFYTPTSVGTALADGTFPRRFNRGGDPVELADPKENLEFNGRIHVLEHGLRPDFGLIKCSRADRSGNLYFRQTSRNFNPAIAMASNCTIVQAEEIVETGDIAPDDIHVPGVFVDVIVHVPSDRKSAPPPAPDPNRNTTSPSENLFGWSRDQIAENIARDVMDGWYVNLGAGIPLLVAKHIHQSQDVTIHMENGILGAGGPPEYRDPDLTDANGQPVALSTGASIFDSTLSFAIVRGGRLDLTVLGALQVSGTGDLANWYIPGGQTGVGGAMDLVQGSKRVWTAMEHLDRDGRPKILKECSFALTGRGVVNRIYTNLAIFSLENRSLELVALGPNVSVEYLRERTEPTFSVAGGIG